MKVYNMGEGRSSKFIPPADASFMIMPGEIWSLIDFFLHSSQNLNAWMELAEWGGGHSNLELVILVACCSTYIILSVIILSNISFDLVFSFIQVSGVADACSSSIFERVL